MDASENAVLEDDATSAEATAENGDIDKIETASQGASPEVNQLQEESQLLAETTLTQNEVSEAEIC